MFTKGVSLSLLLLFLLLCHICSSQNVSPNVTCPNNIMAYSRYTKPVTWDPPTVTDDVDTDLVATCTPPSGSSFNSGSSRTITCTATDSMGNTDECNFNVRILRAGVTRASLNKPAFQSTTYSFDGVEYEASLAVNYATSTCSRTIESLLGATIHASTSTSSLFDDDNICESITSLTQLSTIIHCITTLISGQYVSISKMGNADLIVCNVQVYVDITRCLSDPCQNGGTCMDFVNRFECNCTSGWIGETCGIDFDECSSNPCLNLGTCIDNVDSYTCQCLSGWTGGNCQTDTNVCGSNPCMNAGSCSSQQDEFNCTCLSGFSGSICEINTDECESNPCYYNGTCIDGVNDYICQCTSGWTGVNCDQDSENPTVICPSDIEQSSDIDQTTVTWSDPPVSDNVDTGLSAICTPPSGSLFDIGSTDVICSSTDTAGNTGSCAFTLTISGSSSVPVYLIAVIIVLAVIILVMFAAFIIYRVQSQTSKTMMNDTTMVKVVNSEYETHLPMSGIANVTVATVPDRSMPARPTVHPVPIVPVRPTVNEHTYSTIEPEYIEIIK
ncbi:uncharacterized protein [Antedon mediterranea]|uniref:uncharacterized protein isoform X2 n=1 Tax=Antedon mediterranea TaxID=105859 RepID=UPI003AF73B5F